MLSGAPREPSNPTNGARIGISRYVMVQRIPDTTMAVVVARRAPIMASLSTTSPIYSSLRMKRSAVGRSG